MRLNLAERAGGWSAAHWKSATAVWVAFVAVAIAGGAGVGTRTLTETEQSDGEAARAARMLAASGFRDRADESVLVQSRSLTADDPRFRRTVKSVVATLRHRPEVTRLRSPLAHLDGQVSRDRHSALV